MLCLVAVDRQLRADCILGAHIIAERKVDRADHRTHAVNIHLGGDHIFDLAVYAAAARVHKIVEPFLETEVAVVVFGFIAVLRLEEFTLPEKILVVHHLNENYLEDLLLHYSVEILILLVAERERLISKLSRIKRNGA